MVYDMKKLRLADAGPVSTEELANRGLPRFARLEIPLSDPFWYRTVASELRDLANKLDLMSRQGELNPLQTAMCVLWDIRAANQKISQPTKSSRSG
jgi:hypothetical protein